jgi:hypothetical protein
MNAVEVEDSKLNRSVRLGVVEYHILKATRSVSESLQMNRSDHRELGDLIEIADTRTLGEPGFVRCSGEEVQIRGVTNGDGSWQ